MYLGYPMIFRDYRMLPISIKVLFIGRIVNRMGDFVRTFLTLYLTLILNQEEDRAGIVVMFASLLSMAGAWMGGILADRFRRKKVMLSFQMISALLIGAVGFIPENEQNALIIPLILILSQFFFGAIRPVNSAMVTDNTTPENRKAAFSLLYLGINIGFAIGPVLAGFLFYTHRPWIFWGDAITSVISGILVLFFVQDIPPEKRTAGSSREEQAQGGLFKVLLERPILLTYILTAILGSFIYSQAHFSMPLLFNEIFGEKGPQILGTAHSFNALVVLVFTPLILLLSRIQKPLTQISLGTVAYAIGFGFMGHSGNSVPLVLFYTWIWTLGEILIATNGGVFIANHSPVNLRAQVNSLQHIVYGLGAAITPLISGLLIQRYSVFIIWPICFILGLITAAIRYYLKILDQRQ